MDLLIVLIAVLTPVYFGAMALLAIGLCRAAKHGDEVETLRAHQVSVAPRAATPAADGEPVLVSGGG